MDGIQLAREINSRKLKVATIAVSAYDDEDCLATLSAEGVMGFVLKSSGRTELIAAIRATYQHESYVDPRVAGKLMSSFAKRKNENNLLGELSPREKVNWPGTRGNIARRAPSDPTRRRDKQAKSRLVGWRMVRIYESIISHWVIRGRRRPGTSG